MATVKMLGIQELNRALKAEVKKLERRLLKKPGKPLRWSLKRSLTAHRCGWVLRSATTPGGATACLRVERSVL
jgi:hypothetical protein